MNRTGFHKNPLHDDDSCEYREIESECKTDNVVFQYKDQDQSQSQPQRPSHPPKQSVFSRIFNTSNSTPNPPKKKKINFDMDTPNKVLDWIKHPDQYTKSLHYISPILKLSPFQICCYYQPNTVILKMIETFTAEELNIRNGNMRNSPFMYCCRRNRTECALAMIDKFTAEELKLGGHMNGDHYYTPFMYCCRYCPPEIPLRMMERFTANELNIHQHDRLIGYTTFMTCCIYQPPDVVLKMIELYSSKELNIFRRTFQYTGSFKICHNNQPQYVVDAFMKKFGRILAMD